MLFHIILLLGTFLTMEGVAWLTHKYIMHGFMWNWHHSHHRIHTGGLEKNDLFSVLFSIPAVICIILGNRIPQLDFLFWIGIGVASYGICYFIFHDIIVHCRIKGLGPVIKRIAQHSYMKRIMGAHYIHHRSHGKEGAQAFGFLFAPKKFDSKIGKPLEK